MASSSATTTSSGGSFLQEEMKKRRRMISNRESARRSRMRKQNYLNELVTQLSQLRSECNQVMGRICMTTQCCVSLEAENSVLRAQVAELDHRLRSLNDIIGLIGVMKQPIDARSWFSDEHYGGGGGELNDSLSCVYAFQPVMGSSEMIMYSSERSLKCRGESGSF